MTFMRRDRLGLGAAAIAAVAAGGAWAGGAPKPVARVHTDLLEPIAVEAGPLPRNMTAAERASVEEHGFFTPRAVTPPPTGPVRCVAEYEPMESLILVWDADSYSTSWRDIVEKMAKQVTTTGNARAYIVTRTSTAATSALNAIMAEGADMSKVISYIRPGEDSIWMRDYGPRYIYQGDCRAVVDHTYNRPRPDDNAFNGFWAPMRGHPYYELPLVHGGGNYHLDATGFSWSTELIENENPSLTPAQIQGYWSDYQSLDTEITDAFPGTVDLTQHIDMWMIRTSDTTAIVNDYPLAPGSAHDVVADTWAANLAADGYTVHRLNAKGNPGATHYTYANAVICNDLVLVPFYNAPSAPPASWNTDAVAVWQTACPGKTIVTLDCDALVTSAGVLHCIVMHVPANKNGANPGAYLVNLNGGEVLDPGEQADIQWISADDVDVVDVDILLSLDGGATFPTLVASATADDGLFTWTVPDEYTDEARIRVVARDASANTGSDDSDADFTINGTPPPACPADLNGDLQIDTADLGSLLAVFGGGAGPADLNGDSIVDTADLGALLAVFGPCS